MKKLILGIALITVAISCKKEGCKDSKATNYNSLITKDNGSCTYESSVTFWWGQSTYNWLYNINYVDKLIIKIDGEIVLSEQIFGLFWTNSPNCEINGLLKYTLKMGKENVLKKYLVTDEEGNSLWSGTVTFTAGICTDIELKN